MQTVNSVRKEQNCAERTYSSPSKASSAVLGAGSNPRRKHADKSFSLPIGPALTPHIAWGLQHQNSTHTLFGAYSTVLSAAEQTTHALQQQQQHQCCSGTTLCLKSNALDCQDVKATEEDQACPTRCSLEEQDSHCAHAQCPPELFPAETSPYMVTVSPRNACENTCPISRFFFETRHNANSLTGDVPEGHARSMSAAVGTRGGSLDGPPITRRTYSDTHTASCRPYAVQPPKLSVSSESSRCCTSAHVTSFSTSSILDLPTFGVDSAIVPLSQTHRPSSLLRQRATLAFVCALLLVSGLTFTALGLYGAIGRPIFLEASLCFGLVLWGVFLMAASAVVGFLGRDTSLPSKQAAIPSSRLSYRQSDLHDGEQAGTMPSRLSPDHLYFARFETPMSSPSFTAPVVSVVV